MDQSKKKALGRGLEALLGGSAPGVRAADGVSEPGGAVMTCPLDQIHPRPDQPRQRFDEAALAELAQSIREHGVLQPLLVRRRPGGDGYELIIGERRWRASRLAGLASVPVMVRSADDRQSFSVALIENLQREDLNALEVAYAYHKLQTDQGITQEELARVVGKDRSHVANHLRLLSLDPEVRRLVEDESLSFGHARALAALKDPVTQRAAAARMVSKAMSVRQAEQLVDTLKREAEKLPLPPPAPDPAAERTRAHLEDVIKRRVGAGAALRYDHRTKSGSILLSFKDLDDLDRLLALLGVDQDAL